MHFSPKLLPIQFCTFRFDRERAQLSLKALPICRERNHIRLKTLVIWLYALQVREFSSKSLQSSAHFGNVGKRGGANIEPHSILAKCERRLIWNFNSRLAQGIGDDDIVTDRLGATNMFSRSCYI